MRAVKIAFYLLGGLLFGLLAANNVYRAYLLFQSEPELAAVRLPSTMLWTGLLVIASAVCTVRAMLVVSPGQSAADEEAPMRPPWLDENAKKEASRLRPSNEKK